MTRIARGAALLALTLLAALALAGPAAAKDRTKHRKGAHAAKKLPERWVKKHKARSAKADPDGDGLSNWGEWRSRTKPKRVDSDRDGVADGDEDADRDRLGNGAEEDARTDPRVKDTDRDGVRDGAEDADADGLTNAAEELTRNRPRDPDTDDDGIRDGDENAGTIAAVDAASITIALAVGGTLTAALDDGAAIGCGDEDLGDDDFGDDGFGDDEDLGDDDLGDDDLGENDVEEDGFEEEDGSTFVTASLAEEGDEDDPADEEWEDWSGDSCADMLVPGIPVHEAVVEDGVLVALELVLEG